MKTITKDELIYDAIDLYNKLYKSMDYVIYSHELFNSECTRYEEYMTSRRGLEPVINNLIQEFNLNSDNYPDTMSDEAKKQYQASKEKELSEILEAIKNEFDKFFNELKYC